MIKSDPLSFLDEYTETNNEPTEIKSYSSKKIESDPLSFLDESSEHEKPSLMKRVKGYFTGQNEEASDPLSFLDGNEKSAPEKSVRQGILDIYTPEEKTPEQLKAMSIEERMEYAQDLKNLRELQQGSGFAKGALSGLTLSASEHIPGLKPDENDLMVGLGETVGSFLPISKLYNFIGKPLVNLAAKSPVARKGLEALARMTGFGITGATYESGKDLVQGEVPTPEELLKTGATWAAIDGILQTMGLGVAFQQSVARIAEAEGVTTKEVLGKLWDSTKNFLKKKFISPEAIAEPEIEILMREAQKAEAAVAPKETEIEIIPEKVETEVRLPKESEKLITPEFGEQLDLDLTKAKNELANLEKAQGKGATPEKSLLIQQINKLELEKHNRSKQEMPQEKVSKPEEELEVAKEEVTPNQVTFTTSKGSTYQVDEDGSTIRTKAVRPEHPGEEGLQPKSEKTWYVTPEDSVKLGEFQTKGEDKKIVELPNGQLGVQLGVQYVTGKDAGKIEQRTLADFSKEPKEGLIPVESWKDGNKIHFGNQIVKIEKPELVQPEKAAKEEFAYTREDFPTKTEAQEYLDHLQQSLKKAPEAQKPNLQRNIKNLEDLVSGFDKEEMGEVGTEELLKKQTQVPPRQTRPRQPVKGKKQAVARSKIINLFRTAFNDPIRLGKIKQRNAAGIHKLWPRVTRLLKDNDVETAAHEIGHNLHTVLYGGDAKTAQEQFKNINDSLKPYLNELKPLAHYEPYGMEGFAEFTRLYVTNPDVALELAPKFYAKFEADLEAQYPEMKNALLEARDYYEDYLQGTPQSRIRAQTNYASDKGKLANIIDSIKDKFGLDKLKTEFLDDVFPAKRLVAEAFGIPLSEVENLKDERNLYRSLRVLKGAVGKGDVFVLHETFNAKTLDKINGSLRDILKQLPNEESYREFNDYLIARRALEKSMQKVETGINAGDALAVEAELRPKYGELAKELDKYNDTLLKYAKDTGLLSGEQYVMIKQNNLMYAPFQRVMESEKGGAATGGERLQAGKPIKRMKGSTRDIIAPVESIIKNTYSIIINAEKNLSGQVLANLAKMKNVGAYVEHVPTPMKLKGKVEGEQVARELAKRFEREGLSDLIEYDADGKPVLREDIADAIPEVFLRFGAGQYPAGENIVTVYFDGKPKYYEVTPDLFEMWTKGIAPYTAGLLTKILRIPARTLRAGAILNPRFMLKNVVRDTWGSWLFTKYGKSVKDPVGLFIDTIYSPLAMLATATGKGALYVEWMKAGGGMSTMQSLDSDAIMKKLEEVRHGLKPYQVIKWLRLVAEISEEANRLAEFGRALDFEGKTRLGREMAAFAARDLSIDFAKIGIQTKALNQIIPFFNAVVQGGDKFLRTLANPEDRKNFIPRILGFIVLPSLMLSWLNKDDERVKEFYEEEKDFNFITFVGDQAIKIPVPFETGVIAHGLTQRMFNYFMKKDPEAFEKFMGSVMSAMLPNVSPTFINPFFETIANKNFFTGARLIPMGKEGLISKYQYKNNTSTTARLLGRAMTYMLGQDTRSKAASPAIIDHFIHSWTGGLGRLMIKISDASLESSGLSDKIPGPQQAITEWLELDAFSARFPRASTRSIEKFYDNYQDATSRQKSFKYAEKMDLGTEEELESAYKRFDKVYDYKTLQQAYKSMQTCQKEINNIWNDPGIDPELKKQMIDDLYLQQIDFAKSVNEDIRQYRLAQED